MISFLKSIFFPNSKSQYKLLEEKINTIEQNIEELQILSHQQSEMISALAAVQVDVISTFVEIRVPDQKFKKKSTKNIYVMPVDDDDLIN